MHDEAEYGANGRWGGRLTSKPLPAEDPLLDVLRSVERESLARIWLLRSAMERRVGESFRVIHGALTRRGAAPTLVDLAERAIDDEFRHAELSRVVASRIAGKELPMPERLPFETPRHEGATPELRDALFVVGQCALNETTASAYLEACLQRAEGSVARSALRELLSDEIDHGRIGWAYLASLDPATRAQVARWLLPMAYVNLKNWRKETPDDPGHAAAMTLHGAPQPSIIHAALVDALKSLVVPGLRQLEMDTSRLERWLDAGASTDTPPVELVG
jgi:hypothetical protein